MSNAFHVRYQERIEVRRGRYIMVVDTLMPLDEFLNFITPETVESLLSNTGGHDKDWQDNGLCCVTQAPLEHRVVGVICPSNFKFINEMLIKCPVGQELADQYHAAI